MLYRILTIGMNTYREAVRARILHGLLAVALATTLYSLVLGTLSLHQDMRVVADIGSSSISLYAVLVAIVLGATSLHREIELKTIFPILTRPLRRYEYVLGKYVGMIATLTVFVAIDGASVLGILAAQAGRSIPLVVGCFVGFVALAGVLLWRLPLSRVFVFFPWSLALVVACAILAEPAGSERRLVLASMCLTIFEVAIISAVALLFSSFSSPFLTAIFSGAVFMIGRSADTLAHLPVRFLGKFIHSLGSAMARVAPNLHLYVPARPLLLGEVDEIPIWPYVASSGAHALFYAGALLAISVVVFQRRDFT